MRGTNIVVEYFEMERVKLRQKKVSKDSKFSDKGTG